MKSVTFISCLMLLTSCGVYKSTFECPIGKGIGCKPVDEVLDLIVEKKEGEDVFVNNKGTALLLRQQEEGKLIQTSTKSRRKYYLIKDEHGDWKIVKLPQGKNG